MHEAVNVREIFDESQLCQFTTIRGAAGNNELCDDSSGCLVSVGGFGCANRCDCKKMVWQICLRDVMKAEIRRLRQFTVDGCNDFESNRVAMVVAPGSVYPERSSDAEL